MNLSYENKVVLLNGAWVFLLTQSIVVPFFSQYGLSMAQIFIIQVIHSLMLLIFDIPTSFLADKLGKKKVLFFAAILRGIGGCLFYFSSEYSAFIITYIFIGLGNSMFSGASLAILYDDESVKSGQSLLIKYYNVNRICSMSSLFIGSILASFSLHLTAFINMLTAWIPFLILLSIKKPVFSLAEKSLKLKIFIIYLKQVDKQFLVLLLSASIFSSIAVINVYFGQELFRQFALPFYVYGVIVCSCQLIIICLSRVSVFLKIKHTYLLIFLFIISPSIYFFYSHVTLYFYFIATLCAEMLRWLNQTYITDVVNVALDKRFRSTINSVINFGSIFVVTALGPLIGRFISIYGCASTALFLGGVFLLPLGIWLFLQMYQKAPVSG